MVVRFYQKYWSCEPSTWAMFVCVLYNVLLPRNSLMPLVKMLDHQPGWSATSSMGMLLQGTNTTCSQAIDADCLTRAIHSCLEIEDSKLSLGFLK